MSLFWQDLWKYPFLQHAVLASVISGMREGLLLIGPDRRVRLANSALCDVFEIPFDPEGRLLEEVGAKGMREGGAEVFADRVRYKVCKEKADADRWFEVHKEAHALGIPTTRALAVVATGEPVYRETELPGAVLTRVARSHVRIGTFEYFLKADFVLKLAQSDSSRAGMIKTKYMLLM